MKLQTGKLYWMQYRYYSKPPSMPVVIIDISEERNRI